MKTPATATTNLAKGATVIICPGNGCTNIRKSNWYGYLAKELHAKQIPCICENFPDPYEAKRSVWIPFIHEKVLQAKSSNDKKSNNEIILVGHSSGAQAILRYTEEYPIKAAILVAATYSDLGDAGERASGYYPYIGQDGKVHKNEYKFDIMKQNCPIWYQFHSDNDPFIPVTEAEQIRDGLELTEPNYQLLSGRSHFFEPPFPELIHVLESLTL